MFVVAQRLPGWVAVWSAVAKAVSIRVIRATPSTGERYMDESLLSSGLCLSLDRNTIVLSYCTND